MGDLLDWIDEFEYNLIVNAHIDLMREEAGAPIGSTYNGHEWETREQILQRERDTRAKLDRLIANGYTDPFMNEGKWWIFPPNAVMAVQLDRIQIIEK